MTRKLNGTKIDLKEPILTKSFWKNHPGVWLLGFLSLLVRREIHFLVGPGIEDILGTSRREEFT